MKTNWALVTIFRHSDLVNYSTYVKWFDTAFRTIGNTTTSSAFELNIICLFFESPLSFLSFNDVDTPGCTSYW